ADAGEAAAGAGTGEAAVGGRVRNPCSYIHSGIGGSEAGKTVSLTPATGDTSLTCWWNPIRGQPGGTGHQHFIRGLLGRPVVGRVVLKVSEVRAWRQSPLASSHFVLVCHDGHKRVTGVSRFVEGGNQEEERGERCQREMSEVRG